MVGEAALLIYETNNFSFSIAVKESIPNSTKKWQHRLKLVINNIK